MTDIGFLFALKGLNYQKSRASQLDAIITKHTTQSPHRPMLLICDRDRSRDVPE